MPIDPKLNALVDTLEKAAAITNTTPDCLWRARRKQTCTRIQINLGVAYPNIKEENLCDACAIDWHVGRARYFALCVRRNAADE